VPQCQGQFGDEKANVDDEVTWQGGARGCDRFSMQACWAEQSAICMEFSK
jgi:hypothetical protein